MKWALVIMLGAAAAWLTLNPENRARHRRSGEPLIELPWADGYWEDPDR